LVDTVFEELASDKPFTETCNFLRSHAIRLDQRYKEKSARQIHNASQSSNRSKKDKVKKILALINEIQIQDSCSSDEESVTVTPTKTTMVCKLAQIAPEIWMTLPLEAKKWLLNERKRQQQEDDKMKNSLVSKYTAITNDKDTKNAHMPNQYARVKNVAKGKDLIKENTGHTYAFVDEFLEEAMKTSSLYESDEDLDYEYWSSNHQTHDFVDEFLEESIKSSSLCEADEDVDYEYWSSNHHAHATLSTNNSLHKKCMNPFI
jgi:hypothetical protein